MGRIKRNSIVKNIIILLVLTASFNAAFSQSMISFKTINHDFGLLKVNQKSLTHGFTYVNTGDSALVISEIKYNCKCTALGWDELLLPGDSGQIMVSISRDIESDVFNESFEVVSNAGNGSVSLYLQGQNADLLKKSPFQQHKMGAFAVRSQYLSFGNMLKGSSTTKNVEWFNESDEKITIDSLSVISPDHLKVTFDPYTIYPHSKGQISITLIAENSDRMGYGVDNIKFSTDEQQEDRIKEFLIVSTLFPRVSKTEKTARVIIESTDINLGTLRVGDVEVAELSMTNTGEVPLEILGVDTNCTCVYLSELPKSIPSGESARFNIHFVTDGKLNTQYKQVSIFTNDPIIPVIAIDLKARVIE